MSKQRLVDFQVQLMQRLQSAEAAKNLASWLAIEAAGHKYLLPLVEAGEVVSFSSTVQIEKIAHTKDWYLGVVNLRGAPFAVVDLAGWLGLRDEAFNIRNLTQRGAAFIAFNDALKMSCALLVDRIAGLRSDSDWTEAAPPEGADVNAQYLADKDGQVWQTLRLSDLVRDEYFLSVES